MNMKEKTANLATSAALEAGYAGLAAQRQLENAQATSPISTSPLLDSFSKVKGISRPATEQSYSTLGQAIQGPTSAYYLPLTTGQQNSTSSDILNGQRSTDSSTASGSESRTLGSVDPDKIYPPAMPEWYGKPRYQPSVNLPRSHAHLPTDAKERKRIPLYSGLMKYFPDALVAVASLSYVGNEQHNPGQPLHWAREKSTDQEDALMRHLLEAGTVDTDGVRHSTKCAWRALAMLQLEIERDRK